ncbi:ABC transporter ATP-binding protein [Tateyamaria sp. syn59]|uniref:ABC transporter ATP-binding protein n=1 Tax=Tateyamaria sp. syn59 TaxID=2576942 RepID=UPI0011BE2FCF|nr:ABC transporter ATP-binding protein [Tateyamaria sp. syn59]
MIGLEAAGLSYSYGRKKALEDVSLSVSPGAFCALLGPNGAGKSTLFNLLTRLFVASEGRIVIAGHDLRNNPRAALAELGIVFQQTTLDLDLTVQQNLNYFAALHGLSGRTARARIDAALDQLDMRERAGEKARALNGGHRRRTEIARALLHDPSVLLLDEPTVGLDAAARASITDYAHTLADQGKTVLWATHLTDEVQPDDDLVILHRAKVLAQEKARDIAGDVSLKDRFLSMTGAEA